MFSIRDSRCEVSTVLSVLTYSLLITTNHSIFQKSVLYSARGNCGQDCTMLYDGLDLNDMNRVERDLLEW